MRKLGGNIILIWFLLQLIIHALKFGESETVPFMHTQITRFAYYFVNCLFNIGFASILYQLSDKIYIFSLNKKRTKRLILVLLIYFVWCLIVEFLIVFGIGAVDSAIFTNIDMGIISIGMIWEIGRAHV